MATALSKELTMDFKSMALQCQQLKDNTGAAVNVTELTALTGTTASPAEVNILDGATTLTREINELDSSLKFVLIDDFYGTWLSTDGAMGPADWWITTAGSGTSNAKATTVSASLNGEVTIKSASDDGTDAANASNFTGVNLGWKASSGGLAVETRLKVDVATAVCIFVGFTDTVGSTVEQPIFMVAADIDSTATDACGILYDTDATSDFWTVGGVKNDVDTAPTVSALLPVADTYTILRVEVSSAGAVTAYVDGVSIGTVANAITAATAVTPIIIVNNRSAAQRILTVDYIKVEQNRV